MNLEQVGAAAAVGLMSAASESPTPAHTQSQGGLASAMPASQGGLQGQGMQFPNWPQPAELTMQSFVPVLALVAGLIGESQGGRLSNVSKGLSDGGAAILARIAGGIFADTHFAPMPLMPMAMPSSFPRTAPDWDDDMDALVG